LSIEQDARELVDPPPSILTQRGRVLLERYVEALIDVAAQGKAGFAAWHADDIERIFRRHQRKRPS
jgi:hypothetical protein